MVALGIDVDNLFPGAESNPYTSDGGGGSSSETEKHCNEILELPFHVCPLLYENSLDRLNHDNPNNKEVTRVREPNPNPNPEGDGNDVNKFEIELKILIYEFLVYL